MSICKDGVKFERPKERKSAIFLIALIVLEAIFTFFLYLSLAQHVFDSPPAESAAGIPSLLSYQGRLADASGNPLGGTGTVYCFRYSLYDAQTAGNKLWPAGTASNSTTTVVDGVFSDQIGRMDSLTYDFISTSTVYLNVEVNQTTSTCGGTWETLVPRQQIVASGFALSASNVYGSALRTPTSTKVQIGTGAGVASGQTLLSLDVKNVADALGAACTDNGSLWYNSAMTRALLCENGTIQPVSNSSTTVAAIGVNASTPVSAGTIVFSNSNNVTFGLNGSTITASITAAGGGGGATYSSTVFGKKFGGASTVTTLSQNSAYFFPEIVNANIVASVIKMPVSILASSNTSVSRQVGFTARFGVYTRNATNSTVLTQHYSTSYTLAVSWNSNTSMALSMITAVGNSTSYNTTACTSNNGIGLSSLVHSNREFIMPWNTTLAPGEYWFAILNSSSSAGGAIANALSVSYVGAASLTNAAMGVATSNISGFNIARNVGLGAYSATTGVLPAFVNMTQIARVLSNPVPVIYMLSVTQ